jgi:hypothetical protein
MKRRSGRCWMNVLLARKALMTRIARLEGVKRAWRQSSIWKVRRASESGR